MYGILDNLTGVELFFFIAGVLGLTGLTYLFIKSNWKHHKSVSDDFDKIMDDLGGKKIPKNKDKPDK